MDPLESVQESLFLEFPRKGCLISLTTCIVELEKPTGINKRGYFAWERAVLIKELADGRWVAEIAMGIKN